MIHDHQPPPHEPGRQLEEWHAHFAQNITSNQSLSDWFIADNLSARRNQSERACYWMWRFNVNSIKGYWRFLRQGEKGRQRRSFRPLLHRKLPWRWQVKSNFPDIKWQTNTNTITECHLWPFDFVETVKGGSPPLKHLMADTLGTSKLKKKRSGFTPLQQGEHWPAFSASAAQSTGQTSQ